MENKYQTLGIVNDIPLQVVESQGAERVPVKPLCDIIGVEYRPQYKKLKTDDNFKSVITLEAISDSDGNMCSMVCLPLKYVFGWLFTINPAAARPKARKTAAEYRKKCYDILYDHFDEQRKFIAYKQKMITDAIVKCRKLRYNLCQIKNSMAKAENELARAQMLTVKDFNL